MRFILIQLFAFVTFPFMPNTVLIFLNQVIHFQRKSPWFFRYYLRNFFSRHRKRMEETDERLAR